MIIEAPYPGPTGLMVLPEPHLGNGRSETTTLILKHAMDSTVHTYINKRTNKRVHRLSFTLTRMKALEYLEFMKIHISEKMKFTFLTYNITGYVLNNPVELEMTRRAVRCNSSEEVDLDVNLETTE